MAMEEYKLLRKKCGPNSENFIWHFTVLHAVFVLSGHLENGGCAIMLKWRDHLEILVVDWRIRMKSVFEK